MDDLLPPDASVFESEAIGALGDFREALKAWLGDLPDQPLRAAELGRALHLDKKLAWTAHAIARHQGRTREVAHLLPGSGVLRTLLKAARKNPGSTNDRVKGLEQAVNGLETVIERHAGDRDRFASMIRDWDLVGRDRLDLKHRRAAFRAHRHLLGLETAVQLSSTIVHPSAEQPSRLDVASVRGQIGLLRLREDAPCIVSRSRTQAAEGDPSAYAPEPVEPGADPDLPLLRAFMPRPAPRFRRLRGAAGQSYMELVGSEVGRAAATTWVSAEVWRGAEVRSARTAREALDVRVAVRVPAELLIADLWVPHGVFGRTGPIVTVRLGESARVKGQPAEAIRPLGSGVDFAGHREIPFYASMAEYVLACLGWRAADLTLYRCEIPFPVVPSTVSVSLQLPPADS